jgi:paraquat-inducible protein B
MSPNRLQYSDIFNICDNCGSYVFGTRSFSYVEHARIAKIAQVFQVKHNQILVKFVSCSLQIKRKQNKLNKTKQNKMQAHLNLQVYHLNFYVKRVETWWKSTTWFIFFQPIMRNNYKKKDMLISSNIMCTL